MNYPLYIANRLSLATGNKKKAPAVTVAIVAVALSVAVMLASIAIVLGFKQEIRNKVVGFNAHITLYVSPTTSDEDNLITMIPSLEKVLDGVPFITDYSLQAAIPAILKTNSDFKGVYLKGLSGELTTNFIGSNLVEGELVDFSDPENKNKVIISGNAARQLKLKCGDKIDTYFISDDVRVRRLEIVGIYNSHFDQYDEVMIYGSLPLVQQLGGIQENQGTYMQIMTDNFDNIAENSLRLQQILNEQIADGTLFRLYRVDNVLNQGMGFFNWLQLLDTNVVVVLVLMMIVGAITLVSGMLILIIDKKRFIGLMKAMGAPTSKVRKIFIYLAIRIALIGLIIGNLVMLSLIYLQDKTHFLPLDAESYYIDFVPVSISWFAVATLNIGVVIIMYFVLILPSRFVAGISPAETMRYE
ncbi:MAG: ABC transporter permease [Bacteroides sp.]|nr:ABC transporter permease [Bacteroides sp.]